MKALLFATVLFSASAFATEPAVPPVNPGADEPEKKAGEWLKGLGEGGLVIKEVREGDGATGFVGRPIAGSKSTMFVLSDDNWYITLGFDGEVSEKSTVETLREKWSYIALDKVPTPGLAVEGWEIKPRTPVSSLRRASGAVEFISGGDGKVAIRVKTNFFALYGRKMGVLVPADAGLPPGTYFQIRKPFNLDLTIEAPFAMGKK